LHPQAHLDNGSCVVPHLRVDYSTLISN
jgi:hypothetical protein